jgi:catechol 2,3-dioxygenase-like lactoylglutathione lyase family enzyme
MIVGLDHVQVAAPVGCEHAARDFYGRLLGLEEIEKAAAPRRTRRRLVSRRAPRAPRRRDG